MFVDELDCYSNARLNNISWYLTDATRREIGVKSCKEAVCDAVTKVNQYARAVPCGHVTPMHIVNIREIESEPLDPSVYPQMPAYRHSSGVNLTPQYVVLNCAVEVTLKF
ncbi:Protein of unknown function DUF541 [Penicillium roqueforti FM164]|uniref:Uncharacterized protein n=1 Tax=Penicillium roqueforti (strain FM164) TaxID=1365484 RepID=W6Q5I3_PENRF|nr:Protein of unknown function DUF541 [Penicillium roqueforti FM164]